MSAANRPLWTPSAERLQGARLTKFRQFLEQRSGRRFVDYHALHDFSVTALDEFWRAVWDFCGVIGDPGARVVSDQDRMPGAKFFPDAQLNFAENLLRRNDSSPALISETEAWPSCTVSWNQLGRDVRRAARALQADGVRPGDRVCGIVTNTPETIIAALGAAAVGATWSSCSPDFGVQGVLDRFGQITPTILLSIDGYEYGGKHFECLRKLDAVGDALPTVKRRVVIPSGESAREEVAGATLWREWLEPHDDGEFPFTRFPFSQPLYILYSSAKGLETYFLNFASNPAAEAVAARENASSGKTMGNLPEILRAIALNNKLAESRELATMVQGAMVQKLKTQNGAGRDLGVKQAPFVVLIGAQMPSVLAEISFLTNKPEASLLKQGAYRQKIAQALCDAVMKYRASLKKITTVATKSDAK